jgi:hypothetical protein
LQGSQLTDFINARKSELYNTVTREHSDNFEKVHGDLIRAGDTLKNTQYYHVRNNDLNDLQNYIYDSAKSKADAVTFDNQIAKRQFEMNEWTVGNKQDTLFFMQLTLIGLTLYAPLLYLNRIGMFPSSTLYAIGFLIFVALVLTFVVRYQYTDKSRDYTFWNRRRFAQMGGPPTPPTCESIKALSEKAVAAAASVTDNTE